MKTFLLGLLAVASLVGSHVSASPAVQGETRERALIAYMRVQPGTEQAFLKAAEQVIVSSRQETGNLVYELHQSVSDSQQFVFYELFKTDADLQYHRNSKHVKEFLAETKAITIPGQFILEEYKLK